MTNEHADTMETATSTADGEGMEAEAEARAADEAIGAELRQVGDRLAAAIRAAVGTEEAVALRAEVRAGIRRMREEVEEAIERAPLPRRRKSADGGDDTDEVTESETASRGSALRHDIAHALRGWAERMASAIEPAADTPSSSPQGDDTSHSA